MRYGICNLSAVPMRLEADHRSEQISQLLFGESFTIESSKGQWLLVESNYDSVRAWVEENQIIEVEKEYFEQYNNQKLFFSNDFMDFISLEDKNNIPISLGSHLMGLDNFVLKISEKSYNFEGDYVEFDKKSKNKIVDYAFTLLNVPFIHGGKTVLGIDSSALIQLIYKLVGIRLPRTVNEQSKLGEVLSFIEEAEPGDIAFFDNEIGEITHGGIILDDNYIIHAFGKVRIDRLDQSGIFNIETKRHSHKLRVIKKIC